MSDIDYRAEVERWTEVAGFRWMDIRNDPELYYMYDADFLDAHLKSMGLANYWNRTIGTMPVTNNLAYMVFMHEMGHVMSGHDGFHNPYDGKTLLLHENQAWTWAFEHMLEPPTPESLAEARAAFKSYVDNHPGAYRFVKDRVHPWLLVDA